MDYFYLQYKYMPLHQGEQSRLRHPRVHSFLLDQYHPLTKVLFHSSSNRTIFVRFLLCSYADCVLHLISTFQLLEPFLHRQRGKNHLLKWNHLSDKNRHARFHRFFERLNHLDPKENTIRQPVRPKHWSPSHLPAIHLYRWSQSLGHSRESTRHYWTFHKPWYLLVIDDDSFGTVAAKPPHSSA